MFCSLYKRNKRDEEGGDAEEGGVGRGVSKLSQKDRDNVDYHKQEQVMKVVVMMMLVLGTQHQMGS